MAEETVDQTSKEELKGAADPNFRFKIISKDETLLYQTNQQELDDCFYAIISIMSWTKTFSVGKKLKLTFNTISEDQKMALLTSVREWSEKNNASNNMFDQYLNRLNLAYYMSYIEMDTTVVNLKEKKLEDRLKFFGTMSENALQLYGTYLFVFLEIIRLSLLDQVSLKNS